MEFFGFDFSAILPFIAIKVIDERGNELMAVRSVGEAS